MGSPVLEEIDTRSGWTRNSLQRGRLPRYAVAVLKALRLSEPDPELLDSLSDEEWRRALKLCDSRQLTLILGKYCRESLPEWVSGRIDRDYRNNRIRYSRLNSALTEIACVLDSRGIEFTLLKGQSHSPHFTPDPLLRAQGDIDLWCLPNSIVNARDALLELGYFPIAKANGRHLPPMIRETAGQWSGDYFAEDLPIAVDLHYGLWEERKERIPGPPENEFWGRRRQLFVEGRSIPVLCEQDTLAFASLHLLMHLLRGDLRLHRAWEIAHFLHTRAFDEAFWHRWQLLHPAALRRLEALTFVLSAEWFGCTAPMPVAKEEEDLPRDVKLWVQRYALAPVEAIFHANKKELWLHLALLNSSRDKARVFVRRVVPLQISIKHRSERPADAPRLERKHALELKFVLRRFGHHSRTLLPTLAGAIKWWWVRQQLGRDFILFQLSSALFDFGEFIFFLLFNLYLLERGFDEQFLGQAASAMTAGTIVGAIPTAVIARRMGLRSMLLLALVGAPIAGIARAIAMDRASILASSFAGGVFMSVWAVSFAPVISAATNERNRAFGFSLLSATGIGLGSLAGILGGHLPGVLQHMCRNLDAIGAKRFALLIGCGIAALGAIPATRVKLKRATQENRTYPKSRFIVGFLAALLIWSFATGAFNPFFNAYFSHREHMSVERIGLVYSLSQSATVGAVLLAPMVLKRLGQVGGVAAMQAATAVVLGCLAITLPPRTAALMYVGYVSFQYMSEPCLLSMLMSRVNASERSGASALNFFVSSVAGSLSALISGAAIARYGYSPVLSIAAVLAVVAAALFWALVREDA